MEVILLENIRKLGKLGETVRVRDGFARNFLIPNRKALYATDENKKVFDARKAEIEKANSEKLDEAKKVSSIFEGKIAVIIRQAGEDGRLYGSVTASDIAEALSNKKAVINRRQVTLDKSIKTIGIFPIKLQLHSELELTININVARSEAEAKIAENKFKKGEYVAPEATSKKKSREEILAETEAKLAAEQAVAGESTEAASNS